MDLTDIARRAGKTALQTFLGLMTVEVVTAAAGARDVEPILAAAAAAAAAAYAVIHNALLAWTSTD